MLRWAQAAANHSTTRCSEPVAADRRAAEAAALPVINGYKDAWLEPIADEEEQGDEEEEEEEREQATHRSATSAAMKR